MWSTIKLRLILILIFVNKSLGPNMDPIRASVTHEEQRAFIKLHYLLEDTPAEIHRLLVKAAKSLAVSQRDVYYIYNQFRDGERQTCEQLLGARRPRTMITEEMKERLRNLLYDDRNWSTQDFAEELGVNVWNVRCMLRELDARKVSARWVQHSLNPVQMAMRVDISKEHLKSHKEDPTFLDRLVTIDESYVKSYDPKDAQGAREWRLPDQEP